MDFLRRFRTDFEQYFVGIGNTGGVDYQTICCILVDFIVRFQLKYSWLAQLRRHQQCRWRQYIARFMFWGVVGSPEGRFGLVLTFLQSFLATLIFEFSGTFLEIFRVSIKFLQEFPDVRNFLWFYLHHKWNIIFKGGRDFWKWSRN